ncbi:hypothetical protein H257_12409 [Aphanomyces astaci]|uniref:Uncharacterized protein n=1 Tax=Aphanomyces astaci TaxID=112090 RepID=W4G0V8_APHAT|nr:hypothetical protein H257_12409 [Aphanomyces astaci]ETV72664.1 hypothetical protein H257_12409 [Aphanomyces astaci]|eukprot:XP_009837892.1 hypothetical protein H257_12409 [Aphanomyces astaci]
MCSSWSSSSSSWGETAHDWAPTLTSATPYASVLMIARTIAWTSCRCSSIAAVVRLLSSCDRVNTGLVLLPLGSCSKSKSFQPASLSRKKYWTSRDGGDPTVTWRTGYPSICTCCS